MRRWAGQSNSYNQQAYKCSSHEWHCLSAPQILNNSILFGRGITVPIL